MSKHKNLLFYKNGVKSLNLKFKSLFSPNVSALVMSVCITWRSEESGPQVSSYMNPVGRARGAVHAGPQPRFYRMKLIHPNMSAFSPESLGAVFSEQLNRSVHTLAEGMQSRSKGRDNFIMLKRQKQTSRLETFFSGAQRGEWGLVTANLIYTETRQRSVWVTLGANRKQAPSN